MLRLKIPCRANCAGDNSQLSKFDASLGRSVASDHPQPILCTLHGGREAMRTKPQSRATILASFQASDVGQTQTSLLDWVNAFVVMLR